MTDIVTPEQRSQMMSGIRAKNTKPEMVIRKGLHALGFRYRLHDRSLPGHPDLVFPRYRAVVFVHGCFWHGHNCHLFKWPSTRQEFWREKLTRNMEKDAETLEQLTENKWRILTVWECAIRGKNRLSVEDVVETIAEWIKTGTGNCEIGGKESGAD